MEKLDYSSLYKAYSHIGRNPAVEPKLMFKILVYAYSQTIYSSRKIEQACRRDINFLWLLAGNKAPDHSTIARFRTLFLNGICEELFAQLCRLLLKYGEVTGRNQSESMKPGCRRSSPKCLLSSTRNTCYLCTRSKNGKQLYVSKIFIEKRNRSLWNILSKEGIRYRVNLSIQVEGAFGVLKSDYGFRRFLTCGKTNVKIK